MTLTSSSSLPIPHVHAYCTTTNHHNHHLQIKRKPPKTLHFVFISTTSFFSFPFSPSSTAPQSSHHHHHRLLLRDSTNYNFLLEDPDSAVDDDNNDENRRIFIQEPQWISSLFMKGLLMRKTEEEKRRNYEALRRRQVEVETEAWERTVEEYRALEREMRVKHLAPNLPHVKALMLGWFEPLKEAVEAEQTAHQARTNKRKASFAPHVDSLPADKVAVIVMHKMMALVMENEGGCVRLVQAAVQIGMAVEQEVL